MDRRKFLRILAGSGASLYAMDLDKLLWVPGEKTIFIPPAKQLIYASEVVSTEWEHVAETLKNLYQSDKLLYRIINNNPEYKHEAGNYKTVQIYHGYEEKKR